VVSEGLEVEVLVEEVQVDLGKRKAAIFLQNRGCEMVAGYRSSSSVTKYSLSPG
jgi:hypothetical protein